MIKSDRLEPVQLPMRGFGTFPRPTVGYFRMRGFLTHRFWVARAACSTRALALAFIVTVPAATPAWCAEGKAGAHHTFLPNSTIAATGRMNANDVAAISSKPSSP